MITHAVRAGFVALAKMAVEIWNLLKKGILSNAANLTDDNQIASVSRWYHVGYVIYNHVN